MCCAVIQLAESDGGDFLSLFIHVDEKEEAEFSSPPKVECGFAAASR